MYKNINNNEFKKGFEQADAVILDVRTKEEFDSGYIKNAIHIDILNQNFETEVSKLDKSKTYYIYCRSGGRSASACSAMGSMGFTKLYNLDRGVLGWDDELISNI